ncbi:shikimate dehydrogenase, partial [Fusobacterium sp.]|uniref:shikimate dehydrogenase family protein n=1 Tax=Fusobacterium sp. TaxID=68766 RepID=UPI00345B60DA
MKFGLIGEKLSHSLSPEIHKKIFENLKISGDYSLIELKESEILDFFRDRSMEYSGFNVTIPYKVKLMDFMEEISDEAREIGAINTIFQKNGKFYGYNTDYFGYKRTLEENNIDIKGKDITILGAGGASRAVLKYSFDEGIKNILIVARNIEKAKKELDSFLKNRDNIEFLNFEEFEKRKEKG